MRSQSHLVFITGATRGLGKQIAYKFWEDGNDLVLVSRGEDTLNSTIMEFTKTGDQDQLISAYPCDISDSHALSVCLEKVMKESGNPDIIINNAAIQGPVGSFSGNLWEKWHECLNVCLLAPVKICQFFLPSMIDQSFGRIINISGGGATGPRPNFSSYATAKAGLVRFSETIALETYKHGITVNCVAPGVMNSSLTESVLEAGRAYAGDAEYDAAQKISIDPLASGKRAADLVYSLTTEPYSQITGKLISAIWDPWDSLPAMGDTLLKSDLYTLRRIAPGDMNYQRS